MNTSAAQTVSGDSEMEYTELVEEPPSEQLGSSASGESAAKLLILAHKYDEARHGAYVRHLKSALEGKDSSRIRNIALTGGYGSGKSSILEALDGEATKADTASWRPWTKKSPKSRIINLSLSTLGDEPPSAPDAQPVSTTNRIQKELVKQLLYREDPGKVPGSRYRRIGSFRWWREMVGATLGSAILIVLGYITRFTDRLINFAGAMPAGRIAMHLTLFLFLAGVFLGVRWVFRNRIWIEKFIAGPATISLSNTAGSYFDEYLDEIVYFFEATKYDVVIFEDIDRFEDPHIFQTLRELNTILNNSKQLGRNIRFVYAIKDSIFELLGSEAPHATTEGDAPRAFDAANAETERANRTKFFDLVVPVVPFITHRSSRDHLTEILAESGFRISRELVNLVARHITDMRLLKNIHNEFAIFREQLLLSKDRLKGLDADSLFAMVVYKNIHLSDFERIKAGNSQLDELYAASRALIDENIASLEEETSHIRATLARQDMAVSMAESLGQALESYFERTFRHQNVGEPYNLVISMASKSNAVAIGEVHTPDFWRHFTETRETLTVTAQRRQNSFFTFEDISEALGEDLSPAQWEKHNRFKLHSRLKALEAARSLLISADMAQLIQNPSYRFNWHGEKMSFAEVCQGTLTSRLAVDLVTHAHIDRNFALYTSHFQGVHISLQAMNFIIHHVHPNTMGIYFQFSKPEDIEAVLSDADTNLHERSMYNLEIMDYLLKQDDSRCDPIVINLSGSGDDERKFLAAYLRGGTHRAALYRKMAASTPGIFRQIVKLGIEPAVKIELFNAALAGANEDVSYKIDGLQKFVEENYSSMDVFTAAEEPAGSPIAMVKFMVALGVSFPSMVPLNGFFRQLVIEHNLYDVTTTNLRTALDGKKNLALDAIKGSNPKVYDHVLENAVKYAELMSNSAPPAHTISSQRKFVEILEDARIRGVTSAEALIPNAAPQCRVVSLDEVSSDLWPALAREDRFIPSFANLDNYVNQVGGVDEALAILLNGADEIQDYEDETEDEKQALAVSILHAKAALLEPAKKVQLVHGLNLENLVQIENVRVPKGQLLGLLIQNEIVADSTTSFETATNLDWSTREFAIHCSKNFHETMLPAHVPAEDLGTLMTSELVPEAVKSALVKRLPEFALGAGRSALTGVASYAYAKQIELSEEALRILAVGRADSMAFLSVLELALTNLNTAAVSEFLKLMGSPYGKLTEFGGRVTLPRTTAHLAIATFVEKFGRASSNNWDKTEGNHSFLVFMKKQPSEE